MMAETYKDEGNAHFKEGRLQEAIASYTKGLADLSTKSKQNDKAGVESSTNILLMSTLLSNRSMCHLKLYTDHQDDSSHYESLNHAIDDCSVALEQLKQLDSKTTQPLRHKLLYRHAMAQISLASHTSRNSTTKHSDANSIMMTVKQHLFEAEKDVRLLIEEDNNSSSSSGSLKSSIQKLKHEMQVVLSESSKSLSSSSSPLMQALTHLKDYLHTTANDKEEEGNNDATTQTDWKKRNESLRFIHASLLDDVNTTVNQLLQNKGLPILFSIASSSLTAPTNNDEEEDCQTLAFQCLTTACSNTSFVKVLQIVDDSGSHRLHYKIKSIIQNSKNEELILASMRLSLVYMIHQHMAEDDLYYNGQGGIDIDDNQARKNDTSCIIEQCIQSIKKSDSSKVQYMGFNLLSALVETNPETVLASSSGSSSNSSSNKAARNKSNGPSEDEIRKMTPKELSVHRKKEYEKSKRQKERSYQNAKQFCNSGGIQSILTMGTNLKDGNISFRRNCVLALGRIVNCILGDEDIEESGIKKTLSQFLGWTNSSTSDNGGLTIEEIHDDDEEKEEVIDDDDTWLKECMKRGLLTTALLIANSELGTWALQEGWSDGKSMNEWNDLASSNYNNSLSIASEVAAAAASVEKSRAWILSCISTYNPVWKELLMCDDKEVRSGAASVMAKLGLADKTVSSDEGQLFALLESASTILEEDDDDLESADNTEIHSSSSSSTSTERGVEILSYLTSKTMIKDEVASGYSASSKSKSILEKLVHLVQPKKKLSPAVSYALSTIFMNLSVTIETLRKEAFQGKDITAEDYDQLQSMGKTEEEKELENSQREQDSPEALSERIRNMVEKNVPRALVNLMDDATESTKSQLISALTRIAGEESTRGAMIQQGCLSSCIKMSKAENSSEKEKENIRNIHHCIAKMLVTTNPTLLTTSQRMGSVQPLVQLVKDSESTDLQQFEAMLSLTNLASFNDETKDRIIAERGIPILTYAMFSEHAMVRRAATEAMSNLVPHPEMIDHLEKEDNLKLWVVFATDFEDNLECARAAAGCLAMVSQVPDIALKLTKQEHTETMLKQLLESGNFELMHRVMVIILNLCEQGKMCQDFVKSTGSLAFLEGYIGLYNDGEKINELELDPSQYQLMNITIDLGKEIVKKCNS